MFKQLLSVLFFCLPVFLCAQEEFFMRDTLVTDCEGILYDSELGDVPGTYDHNENYTFSICPNDVDFIALTFSEFCTEDLFDSLRVFDGPDTLSTLIGGPYLGEENPPPLTAYSGCMTLNFITDPSVTCTGWTAYWTTDYIFPEDPVIAPIPEQPCLSEQLLVEFDRNIECDSLYPAAFYISGPEFPVVTAVETNCVDDSTSAVLLTYAPPMDFAGNYNIFFTQNVNACENNYVLEAVRNFTVVDCPLNVAIQLPAESGCAGDLAELTSLVSGGDMNYAYEWSPVFSDQPSVTVEAAAMFYYLTVTDGAGNIATDSVFLNFEQPEILLPDSVFCQSAEPFHLSVNTGGGGEFFGIGILNSATGLYDPGLDPYAPDTVSYISQNDCAASLIISLNELDEGSADGACPGAEPFQVSGGTPAGGAWSGDFISPEGIFSPPAVTSGVYPVTYTHPNGCSGTKFIYIDTLFLPDLDTICQSEAPFVIEARPIGGFWTGSGITDPNMGEFDPTEAATGDNLLIYTAEGGCTDSMVIHVKAIEAADDFTACPEQDPFFLPGGWYPVGGTWQGIGVVDAQTGLYDPDLVPEDTPDTLSFSANGCTDTRIGYVIQTEITTEEEFLFACLNDVPFPLPLQRPSVIPESGDWFGDGVTAGPDDTWLFNPSAVGPGFHQIYYEINTCTDSITVVVRQPPVITEEFFCETPGAMLLEASPAGGEWSGSGIINPFDGVFDPEAAGAGTHTVTYTSLDGCSVQADMTVLPFAEAVIMAEDFYCYRDEFITPALSPNGGTFLVNGEPATGFNPAELGPGAHTMSYNIGVGVCADNAEYNFVVRNPLSVSVPFTEDSLCYDEYITISAVGSGGGNGGNYTYNWNNGVGFGQSHFLQMQEDRHFVVTLSDGCSEPVFDSIDIFVADPIFVEFETQLPVCFDDTTSVEVFAYPGDNYTFLWNTVPPVETTFLESYPTSYTVTVTDNNSGCEVAEFIDLPGYDLLQANFGITPNAPECLTILDPDIQVLDFSVGATIGYWQINDSLDVFPYRPGENLRYSLPDTGSYEIFLHLENEGGCVSEDSLIVCVDEAHTLFAPNAMTPNGDGNNDEFGFVGTNIEEIEWQIYNRYGQLLYTGNNMNDRWNGEYNGNRVQDGVYTWVAAYRAIKDNRLYEKQGSVLVLK